MFSVQWPNFSEQNQNLEGMFWQPFYVLFMCENSLGEVLGIQ